MSSHTGKPMRVVWAVDVSTPRKQVLSRVASLLKSMRRSVPLEVEPVYVLNPQDLRLRVPLVPEQMGNIRAAAEKLFRNDLKIVKFPRLTEPKILTAPYLTFQSMVKTFLDYARETDADLIAVGTMSKGPFDRLLLGSFAEALTLKSEIPVVVVGPRSKVALGTGTILFPTDFSAQSRSALQGLTSSLGAKSKAHVVLFHQFEIPIQYTPEPFAALPLSQEDIDKEVARLSKLGAKWVSEIKSTGLRAEFLMSEARLSPADSILKCARKHRPWIIAMASQKGALGAAFLGSTTRRVLRHSSWPVWIVHPEKFSKRRASARPSAPSHRRQEPSVMHAARAI